MATRMEDFQSNSNIGQVRKLLQGPNLSDDNTSKSPDRDADWKAELVFGHSGYLEYTLTVADDDDTDIGAAGRPI